MLIIGGSVLETSDGGGASSVSHSLESVSSLNLAGDFVGSVDRGSDGKSDSVGVVGQSSQVEEVVTEVDVEADVVFFSLFLGDRVIVGGKG